MNGNYDGEFGHPWSMQQEVGTNTIAHNRKDKKRATVLSRLYKLDESLSVDRDYHYRYMLQNLQQSLTSAHAGSNPLVEESVVDSAEERDFELVRLRLWEEYQVQRAQRDYQDEVDKANREHDELVKRVKERLYASLERQVKQLKEDKILLDLANTHSYSMEGELHKHTRSQVKEFSASDRRPRRRHEQSAEESANDSGHTSTGKRRQVRASSADELSGDISSLLNGAEKPATRHSNKSYQPPTALRDGEVSEDLALLRALP